MNKISNDLLKRVQSWPEDAQLELAQIVDEIEAELRGGVYRPTQAELRGIERGLREAAAGKFASDEEIEAIFAKYRGK
jgi:predicted transcriptional regulator